LFAQKKEIVQPTTRILFLFDASQSMLGRWQTGVKMEVAKKLMAKLLDSLSQVDKLEMALRCYGHQSKFPPQDCKDTRLEVPFGANNATRIKNRILQLEPKGTTPIAYSLEKTADDFPPCANCRNIIILITDGIEECGGDPCAISLALQKNGIFLKPFIIGVGLGVEIKRQFECVGNYFDAANENQFRTALNIVISQALNNTTMQVNLLDNAGKPNETNVAMTFYDEFSGRIKYNFEHTLNHKGNPDTLTIDPLGSYKIVVHTIPPVEKDSVYLTAGKHTVVGIEAPQGYLTLKTSGRSDYKNLQAIVRKKGELNTLIVQPFDKTEKYIIGNYDLEILSLPRLNINDVQISQSHTTTVSIPQAGIMNILKKGPGYGNICVEENNELKNIYNLEENFLQENIVLQPGKYRVFFRPKSSKESIYTIEKQVKIESGSAVTVQLY
jgi:Ca-activated chloride channel family protein